MQETISEQKSVRRFAVIALIAALILVGALVAASRTNKPASASRSAAAAMNTKTVIIPVEGMTCISCAASVKSGLAALNGVSEVHISLAKRDVFVRFDDKKLSQNRLQRKIEALGFQVGTYHEGGAK